MQHRDFRYDINGLRAYSILLVILYHFNIPFFKAGFIGVDIFFVISGYFMTKIIFGGLIDNSFNLKNFFYARFMRIVPPLLLVVITFYVISFIILNPNDFKYYCKYVIKSLTFSSNISLLKEADSYFAESSTKNLLLHTWSLAVEWQFYVIYPFICLLLFKFTKNSKIFITSIILLLLMSLSFSIEKSLVNRSYDFYMLGTRAWEMLAGGLVYLCETTKKERAELSSSPYRLKYLGLVAIVLSLAIFSEKDAWPGYYATLVVFGSFLVIYLKNNQLKIFNNKAIYLIGLASYSIYLWHWPIRFFVNYYIPQPGLIINILFAFLSIIVGGLSYFFIEKKLTDWTKKKGMLISFTVILILALAMVGLSDYTRKNSGFSWRGGENYLSQIENIKMPNPDDGWCFYSIASHPSFEVGLAGVSCHIGETEKPLKKALLFGDSYAGQYIPFWQEVGKKTHVDIQAVTTNWCNPSDKDDFPGPKTSRAYQQCLFNRKYIVDNISHYDYIILAGSWSKDFENNQAIEGLRSLVKKIRDKNVPIIIMDEPYQFDENIGEIYKEHLWRNQRFDIRPFTSKKTDETLLATSNLLEEISRESPDTLYLRRNDLFSDSHYAYGDVPYSLDGGHISVLGSLAAEEYFIQHGGIKKLDAVNLR